MEEAVTLRRKDKNPDGSRIRHTEIGLAELSLKENDAARRWARWEACGLCRRFYDSVSSVLKDHARKGFDAELRRDLPEKQSCCIVGHAPKPPGNRNEEADSIAACEMEIAMAEKISKGSVVGAS